MNPPELVLFSRRVVTPQGARPAAVVVRGGKISALENPSALPAAWPVTDVGERVVLPGLVDTHAHINDPGRAEWEGFETATLAAAAGGITAVVDMPLNSIPPTTSRDGLKAKQERAKGRCAVDYAFWGGLVPGNTEELAPLVSAGARGFKAFLIDSGVEEFPPAREKDLSQAMPRLKDLGVPLLIHAELAGPAPALGSSRRYADYLASRPRAWENEAVRLMIRLCRETGCRVHIVHLSSCEALADLAQARREGLPMTAETCPHYLALEAEQVPDGATHYKCAPPIRERKNRGRLWEALKAGEIDLIVSDHSPCSPALKCLEQGDFSRAWGGISGIQFSLPVVWTEMRARDFALTDLARLMAQAPARLAGLNGKGEITVGKDADLVVFDPDAEFKLEPAMVRHKHALTPYAGKRWRGVVEAVYLRGRKIYEQGELLERTLGRPLAPSRSVSEVSAPFADLPDLASEKVGGKVLSANDEFFAPKENLLKPGRGVFIADKFTSRGKWMDGWETRRRRTPGHDWCVVRLGLPGAIRGVDIDTNHFLGNYPEYCSLEAREGSGPWMDILPKSPLRGGTQNLFPVACDGRWTHVRLNIYPDGGVARLRVHGEVRPDWAALRRGKKSLDMAALENGGIVVACNDMFFGPKDNLIMPGRAKTMGEGWETRRKRGPGHDWIVIALGAPGRISKIEVDTNHFKGNYPESCSIEGATLEPGSALETDAASWTEVLPRVRLKPHRRHYYAAELRAKERVFTHLRLNIFPDGGISRLRAYGFPA